MKLYLLVYICIITLISVLVMGVDKSKSIHKKRRISESALMTLAIIGGSVGIYLGMSLFRHKTAKNKFVFGVPLIFILQCVAVFYFLF